MYVYIGLIFIFAIAAFLYFHYLVQRDSPSTRSIIPWSLIIAAIVSFLIVIWIIVYILYIYKHDKVYIVYYDKKDSKYDEDTGQYKPKKKYRKQSKFWYIITYILSPLLNGFLYLLFFFVAKDWVRRH